jgi:hypothetical protein
MTIIELNDFRTLDQCRVQADFAVQHFRNWATFFRHARQLPEFGVIDTRNFRPESQLRFGDAKPSICLVR